MNNFTREELEQLRECVGNNTSKAMHNYGEPIYPALYEKLERLLDGVGVEHE